MKLVYIYDMKKLVPLLFLLITAKIGLACSCYPYEPNFFKNVSTLEYTCIAVFDTMDYSYEYNGLAGHTGYFIVIDTIGNFNSNIGDTIIVTGQDGLNCGEVLNEFSRGDTMFLALSNGFYHAFEKDTFYLEGLCGKHYLKIENGQHAGLTVSQMKQKIYNILAKKDLACFCEANLDYYNFYNNISKATSNVLVVFDRYDYDYTFQGLNAQTGYFKLIDTIGNFNSRIGDTLVVIGEDGINCGEMLNRFSHGDTLFLTLSEGFYQSLGEDTFYLKGGACGYYFLTLTSGQHGGLSIPEIKEMIKIITTGNPGANVEHSLTIYPNPAKDHLIIKSDMELIEEVKIYDMSGRLINSVNDIHTLITDIDLSNLMAGLYNLLIITDNEQVIHKMMKE